MPSDKTQKNLSGLHNTLETMGYSVPNIDQFAKNMRKEENLRSVYDKVAKGGYELPDFDTFKSDMGWVKPTPIGVPVPLRPKAPTMPKATLTTQVPFGFDLPVNPKMPSYAPKARLGFPRLDKKMRPVQEVNDPSVPLLKTTRDVAQDEHGNVVNVVKPELVPDFDPNNGGVLAPPAFLDVRTGKTIRPSKLSKEEIDGYNAGNIDAIKDPKLRQALKEANVIYTPTLTESDARRKAGELTSEIDKALSERTEYLDKKMGEVTIADSPTAWGIRGFNIPAAANKSRIEQATDSEYMTLEAARRTMQDVNNLISEADHNTKQGNDLASVYERSALAGTLRGFGTTIINPKLWDQGARDLSDTARLARAVDKADRGEQLTRGEQLLLDAKANEMATALYFEDRIGRGYKAGSVTANAVPFMVEMAMSGGISTMGKNLSSGLARYAMRRFGAKFAGKTLIKGAIRGGSKIVGSMVAGGAMANTFGVMKTASNIIGRTTGNVQFATGVDAEGRATTTYGGHTEGDSLGKAFVKGELSSTAEYATELLGDGLVDAVKWAAGKVASPVASKLAQFIGKTGAEAAEQVGKKSVLGKVAGSVGDAGVWTLSKASKFIGNMQASKFATSLKALEKQAQWNGVFGEYLEEKANDIAAVMIGDKDLSADKGKGFFNLDDNIDTFLGVSLMGGVMSAAHTVGYVAGGGARGMARYQIGSSEGAVWGLLTTDEQRKAWDDVRRQILIQDGKEQVDAVRSAITNPNFNADQRRAILDYTKAVQKYKGMSEYRRKQGEDMNADPIQNELADSYDKGAEMTQAEEMSHARSWYEFTQQKAAERLGVDANTLDEMGAPEELTLDQVAQLRDQHNERAVQSYVDYLNARATYEGMIGSVSQGIQAEVTRAEQAVRSQQHKDGTLRRATLRGTEGQKVEVHIKDGDLVMDEEGRIDTDKSSKDFIVRDNETGVVRFASIDDIISAEQPTSADEAVNEAVNAVYERREKEAADAINGTITPQVGAVYNLLDADGNPQQIAIRQIGQDGTLDVDYSGVPHKMTTDELQSMADNTRARQIENEHAAQVQQAKAEEREEREQAGLPRYALNDELTIRTPEGEELTSYVTNEEDEDGNIEVYFNQPYEGKKVHLFTKDYLDGVVVGMRLSPESNTPEESLEALSASASPALSHVQPVVGEVMPAHGPIHEGEETDIIGRSMTEEEAEAFLDAISENPEVVPVLELTPENWDAEFGEEGIIASPIGDVKMGENQFLKMMREGRNEKLGMIRPTIERPDVILEDTSRTKEGEDRVHSYVFVKSVKSEGKERLYYFTSVSISKDGREVVISNQERRKNRIVSLLTSGTVLYLKPGSLHPLTQVEGSVSLNDSRAATQAETITAPHGIHSSEEASSANKGSESLSEGYPNDESLSTEDTEREPVEDDGIIGRSMTEEEAESFLLHIDEHPERAPELDLTTENWDAEFGEDGMVHTPIGDAHMGENQFLKMMRDGRKSKLGMIRPTLEAPHAIVEEPSMAKEGQETERDSSYIYIRVFEKEDGSRQYYFTSVSVQRDGGEVIVSNQEKSRNQVKRLLTEGVVLWMRADNAPDTSDVDQDLYSPQGTELSDPASEGTDASQSTPSGSKDNESTSHVDPNDEGLSAEEAYEAVVQATQGDVGIALMVIESTVADKEKALGKAKKAKPRSADTIEGKIQALAEVSEGIEAAEASLAHWQAVAEIAAEQVQGDVVEEEATQPEAEGLTGDPVPEEEEVKGKKEDVDLTSQQANVPEWNKDTPADARARGYIKVEGLRVERQGELSDALIGKESDVKFATNDTQHARYAIIEAESLQPSHIRGYQNQLHFIPEAQPKDRSDVVSEQAAVRIAANINPEEITTSATAYTGAPTINARGEVIQGNSRADALRAVWESFRDTSGAKYKQYLIENAEDLGIDPEAIEGMKSPVLVHLADVSDERAIELGQYRQADIESGGVERINPQTLYAKIGEKRDTFIRFLLGTSDDDLSLAESITRNAAETLSWLNRQGFISDTQFRSSFGAKGEITAEAKEDLRNALYRSFFEGAHNSLEAEFYNLPKRTQQALLRVSYRDQQSPADAHFLDELQASVSAYNALMGYAPFAEAKTFEDADRAVETWMRFSGDLITGEVNSEQYSNFAVQLALRYKFLTQKELISKLNAVYDAVQAVSEDTLFGEGTIEPKTLAEAVRAVFNIEYNSQTERQDNGIDGSDTPGNNGERSDGREQEGQGTPGGNEQDQSREGTAERRGRASSDPQSGRKVTQPTSKEFPEAGDTQASDATGEGYRLSAIASKRGGYFFENSEGSIDLVKISDNVFEAIGLKPMPMRMTESMAQHILDRHGKELGISTQEEAVAFVVDIMQYFDHVREGNKLNTYIFSIEKGRSRTGKRAVTLVLPTKSGEYLGVSSSGYEKVKSLKERALLWEEGANNMAPATETASANVPTPSATQGGMTGGSASNQSRTLSVDKDSEKEIAEGGASNVSGLGYRPSSISGERGGKFFEDKDGSIDLVQISDEVFEAIGLKPMPLRMTESMAQHILDQHAKELGISTQAEAVAFVIDIMQHFDHVREGNKPDTYVFSIEKGRSRTGKRAVTLVLPTKSGEYLGVSSSGYEKVKSLKERALLWEEGANNMAPATETASANVPTPSATQGGMTGGSASNQSRTLSVDKDSEKEIAEGEASEMIPGQRTLLDGTNPRQYSDTQESLSTDKDSETSTHDKAIRDELVHAMRDAGIEVVTDEAEGQAVLDAVHAGEAQMQRAYHGTDADFETFDHSHMGEGAGGQAYGWGSYFTEEEGIARSYAGGGFVHEAELPDDTGSNYLYSESKPSSGEVSRVKRELVEYILRNDEEGLYDYPQGKEALKRELDEAGDPSTWRDLYGTASSHLGSDKEASAFFRSIGYVGIRYNSSESEGAKANFVIFDENDIAIQSKVRLFKTTSGEVYGFVKDGKIYLDLKHATAETAIHEYTHLWTSALRRVNPRAWKSIRKQLKNFDLWNDTASRYPELKEDEDALADEVLAQYSGKRGAQRIEEELKKAENDTDLIGKARVLAAFNSLKEALKTFWTEVADFFGMDYYKSVEDAADKAMSDLLRGVNPNAVEAKKEATKKAPTKKSTAKKETATSTIIAPDSERYYGYIVTLPKEGKAGAEVGDMEEFVGSDEKREGLMVVYHAPEGFAVASNGAMAIADKTQFDAYKKGKAYKLDGTTIDAEAWKPLKDKWQSFISTEKRDELFDPFTESPVNISRMSKYLDRVEQDLHNRWKEAKSEGRTKDSFKTYRSRALVSIPNGRGGYVRYRYTDMRSMALAAKRLGVTSFFVEGDRHYDYAVHTGVRLVGNGRLGSVVHAGNILKKDAPRASESELSYLYDEAVGIQDTDTGVRMQKGNAVLTETEKYMRPVSSATDSKIELLQSRTSQEAKSPAQRSNSISLAKLQQGAEFSHESGKFLLSEMTGSDTLDDGVRYRSEGNLDGVNTQFNAELKAQIEGTLPTGHVYSLGMPSKALRSAGVPNLPIELTARRLATKASQAYHSDHPFELSDIQGLPKAIAHPIAVFDSSTREDSTVVLTELQDSRGVNFVVVLRVVKSSASRSLEVDVNGIRSIYPKDRVTSILQWITSGKMLWVDKKKALSWITTQLPNAGYDSNATESLQDSEGRLDKQRSNSADVIKPKLQASDGEANKQRSNSAEVISHPQEDGVSKTKIAQQRTNLADVDYLDLDNATKVVETFDNPPLVSEDLGIGNDNQASEYNDEEVRYRSDELDEVSNWFNAELSQLTEENADSTILSLGMPSSELIAGGVAPKLMRLYGNKVIKKMKKHGFALSDLLDLPKAVAQPIAVFSTHRDGSHAILTELKTEEGNILVTLEVGKGGADIDFNLLTSTYGKSHGKVLQWLNSGKATYINKEKALEYLASAPAPIAGAKQAQELSLATKVVETFENPELSEESHAIVQMEEVAARTAESLGESVRVIHDMAEIEGRSESETNRMRGAKGWYDPKTGQVVVVLPNAESADDVEATILHEVVGHKGLQELVGKDQFGKFLDEVFEGATQSVREGIVERSKRYGWNTRLATEEYIAELAEQGFKDLEARDLWHVVRNAFYNLLSRVKLALGWNISDRELRYMLWRTYQMKKGEGLMGQAKDIAMQEKLGVGNYDGIRFRQGEIAPVKVAATYDALIRKSGYQTQEALQDSMLSLKKTMEMIMKAKGDAKYIEEIEGYQNAYMGENRLSSVNQAEAAAYTRMALEPLVEEVSRLAKKAHHSYVTDYMMAKHGLERNRVMAFQKAVEADIDAHNAAVKESGEGEVLTASSLWDAYLNDTERQRNEADYRNGLITADVWHKTDDEIRARYAPSYAKYRERDYAGLTGLLDRPDVDIQTLEEEAIAEVMKFEKENDVTKLWELTNKATDAPLSKQYEGGLMSREALEHVRNMYGYYIPLRGFDETTSDDVYSYLGDRDRSFSPTLKKAKGRSSKAEDPLAHIASMMESAILQSNRNKLVRQKFLNFVENNPSDLFSVQKLWVQWNNVTKTWDAVLPEFDPSDTSEEVIRKTQEFEETMRENKRKDPKNFKLASEQPSIPYRVVGKAKEMQHQIIVKRGGRDVVIIVNGDPRVAMAVNGLTNPDGNVGGHIGAAFKAAAAVNRKLAGFYTSDNPNFVVKNFIRDIIYANTIVWVKESPSYALRYHKNVGKLAGQMHRLVYLYEHDKLDMSNETHRAFKLFMENGGETGYSQLRSMDRHKKDVERMMKESGGRISLKQGLRLLGDTMEFANRGIEDLSRFAAFMTSRQMGRTIDRSIYDAKEMTVNFNKKGAGSTFLESKTQDGWGKSAAFISGMGRSLYLFWNVSIQGSVNIARAVKRNPKKGTAYLATFLALGILQAMLPALTGGDDDDRYWNLPDYVRRNNICFFVGDVLVKIPLPQEARAIFGIGELGMSYSSGKEEKTPMELAQTIAGQLSQIMPLDLMDDSGATHAFMPSLAKPFFEAQTNPSWMGRPIWKDTDYNKAMPDWTKAYKATGGAYVWLAKELNEITGGDDYKQGWVNINPAKLEYMLKGYLGGLYTAADQIIKSSETAFGDREFSMRDVPILSGFLDGADERNDMRNVNNTYYHYKEEAKEVLRLGKSYERDAEQGKGDYAKKLDELVNTKSYERALLFDDLSKEIEAMQKELKETTIPKEAEELQAEIDKQKKALVIQLRQMK